MTAIKSMLGVTASDLTDPNGLFHLENAKGERIDLVEVAQGESTMNKEEGETVVLEVVRTEPVTDNKKVTEIATAKSQSKTMERLEVLERRAKETYMAPNNAFKEYWDACETEVEFSDLAHNGTGYLDALVNLSLGLDYGEMTATQDEHGRKILIQGSPWGNIVVFQRYVEDEEGYTPVVCNAPDEVSELLDIGSSLTKETIHTLLHNNYGTGSGWGGRIADLMSIEKKLSLEIQRTEKQGA